MHPEQSPLNKEIKVALTSSEKDTLRSICKKAIANFDLLLFPREHEALLSVFKKLS